MVWWLGFSFFFVLYRVFAALLAIGGRFNMIAMIAAADLERVNGVIDRIGPIEGANGPRA